MATAIQALQAEIQADIERFKAEMPAPVGNKVKILQSKQFQFPDGSLDGNPFKAVILDYRFVNTYYTSAYNPQSRESPPCFAIGTDPNTLVPSEASSQPQCDACKLCIKNQFGSKGKGKACRNSVRLAIIPESALAANAEPWIITVSPTGVKHFLTYANALKSASKLPVHFVTAIGFNPKEAYPTLLFQSAGPNEELELAWALRKNAQAALDREFD